MSRPGLQKRIAFMGIRIRITVKSCTWIPIEVKSQIQDSDQSEKPDEDLDTHQSDADSQH